jgi:REP element-mobilizing transposase RayT
MPRAMQPTQVELSFRSWGGRRNNAGRPKKPGAKLRHAMRPKLARSYPAHVTLRALPSAPNLRRGAAYAAVEAALCAVRAREDYRVVHFSVQTNHVHLLVEAHGATSLARGMQALAIRIARGVNRACGRKGKLWGDRYHSRVLRTPREVRNALCYVLQNTRRHLTHDGGIVEPGWIDPRSSGSSFDGWRDANEVRTSAREAPTLAPHTWLLATGWRRHGLIRVDEGPEGGDHRATPRPAAHSRRAHQPAPLRG